MGNETASSTNITHDSEMDELTCKLCYKRFETCNQRKLHVHECKRIKCCSKCNTVCSAFKTIKNFKVHEEICTGSAYKCPHCPKVFTTARATNDHKSKCRYNKSKTCRLCNTEFPNESSFTTHVLKVHAAARCGHCQRLFDSAGELKAHKCDKRK